MRAAETHLLDCGAVSTETQQVDGRPQMFLPGKRKGASFLIMVVIMAVVMSMFAISVSQLSRSRSSTLISDATEKQVLYLAEDAVNQMIYNLSSGGPNPIGLTAAPNVGPNYAYEAFYASGTKPFGQGCGTMTGTGYLMNPSFPADTSKALYAKTVYVEVRPLNAAPLMVYIKSTGGAENVPYYKVWDGTTWGNEYSAPPVQGGIYSGVNAPRIQFITLSFDPGSNHAMLGFQDTYGNVWAEEWNGSSFSNPYLIYNSSRLAPRNHSTRAFDIAYENTPTSGVNRPILVCDDENAGTYVPLCSIWDGSTWTTPQQVAAVPATMSQPCFVELATNPVFGSKGIGMIYQDSGGRVFGEVWNGTNWSTMGQSALWGTANNPLARAVGLAYESTGLLVFGYGDGKRGYSRNWNGATLENADQFTDNNSTIQWLTMNPVPGTNVVIALYVTSANVAYTLYSSTLTGTAWSGTYGTQGTIYHDYVSTYFNFASSGANKGTLVFSSSATPTTLIGRTWSGGTTWAAGSTTSSWTRSYADIAASPSLSNTLSGYYNNVANSNILEWHTNSTGTWQTMTTVSSGNTLNPAYERLAIAIPVTSGSGFAVVKGTWRENY